MANKHEPQKETDRNSVIDRLCLFTTLVLTLLTPGFSALSHAEEIDRVVLVVNDQAVTATEYASLALIQNPDAEQTQLQPILGTDITEDIVNDLLLLGRADDVGFTHNVSDAQIDSAIDRLAAQNRLRRNALLSQLAARGIDLQIFRQNLRNRLQIEALMQKLVASRVSVSPSEVQAALGNAAEADTPEQEYELVHLLVPVEQDTSEQARTQLLQRAQQIREALVNNAAARELLRDNDWLKSGADDGYLGWKHSKQLPEVFVAALTGLSAGEVSAVTQSPNGLHILKVLNMRGANAQLEYKVKHILLAVSEADKADAVEQAIGAVRTRLLAGEDFAEVAAEVSQDPGSRQRGGDLGWVDPGIMVPAFAKAVRALPVGELSEPVRSRFGYHLVLVEDSRPAANQQNSAEAAVQQQIFARKVDEEIQDLLNDLRQVAHIEVLD